MRVCLIKDKQCLPLNSVEKVPQSWNYLVWPKEIKIEGGDLSKEKSTLASKNIASPERDWSRQMLQGVAEA